MRIDNHTLLKLYDVLFITLDTLRYDVAQQQFEAGRLPNLAKWLPRQGWEKRHSPASFTYAAHQAFFAGFLPTPVAPGPHPRLFAVRFPGSESIDEQTLVFDAPDIVSGFRQAGYHTVCIGGVGFFNKRSPLGAVLPDLFEDSHWDDSLGVTCRDSTRNQVTLAIDSVKALPKRHRVFLFLNVSAIHQPNHYYLPGADNDSLESHAAALRYVDAQLAPLFAYFQRRAPTLVIICSDHGTGYGEQGYYGHRLAHQVVWDVPYADFFL